MVNTPMKLNKTLEMENLIDTHRMLAKMIKEEIDMK